MIYDIEKILVGLEKALKQDKGASEETRQTMHDALMCLYDIRNQDDIIRRVREGKVFKYVSNEMIVFNNKFYWAHKNEQINIPDFKQDMGLILREALNGKVED